MFKRVIWMGTGMAVGAGSAFWAKRKVEATVERYLPEQVADRAATQARNLNRTVREAASEGRRAMRQREVELRSQVEARTFVGPASRTPVASPQPVRAELAPGARRASRPSSGQPSTSGARRRSRR